ncbi:hypothetical protein ACOTVS_11105 [Aliarcobacter butzleri]|uniref:hypothetical protein n=1 Tax=Aliarcobacter butzleri TaxID=28197 RepID=UPI0034502E56
MPVQNKYRSLEVIKKMIIKKGGFETYLQSISISTAKNYKFVLEQFVKESGKFEIYNSLLCDKLKGNVSKDATLIEKDLEKVLKDIEKLHYSLDEIVSKDDFDFMIFLLFSFVPQRIKNKMTKENIKFEIKGNILLIRILLGNERKEFLVKRNVDLFHKLIKTFKNRKKFEFVRVEVLRKIIEKKFNKSIYKGLISPKALKTIIEMEYVSKVL